MTVAGLLWTCAMAIDLKAQKKELIFGGKPQFVGVASWYGEDHQGKLMANGKPFDRHKMTAAAWNLPLGTVVQVVNRKNGKSVIVTITDRGPHQRLNRAIDLSEAAAKKLDFIRDGLTTVFISRIPVGKLESAKIQAMLTEPAQYQMAARFSFRAIAPAAPAKVTVIEAVTTKEASLSPAASGALVETGLVQDNGQTEGRLDVKI
jgi:rare lipoprotein A